MLKCAPLSFGLIGLYRLKFYMYDFIRIDTVHFKNIWSNQKCSLYLTLSLGNVLKFSNLSLNVLIKKVLMYKKKKKKKECMSRLL